MLGAPLIRAQGTVPVVRVPEEFIVQTEVSFVPKYVVCPEELKPIRPNILSLFLYVITEAFAE